MSGIAGGLQVTQYGTVQYEVQLPDANIWSIETEAYFMPNLKCRLLSPQSYIEHLGCTRAKFSCMLHCGEFTWGDGVSLPIPYDKNTFLPTL